MANLMRGSIFDSFAHHLVIEDRFSHAGINSSGLDESPVVQQ
jgi:hypothetical protein